MLISNCEMQLTYLVFAIFIWYIFEGTECEAVEKYHIKIHVPLKQKIGEYKKKPIILHTHEHKHGHHHHHKDKHHHKHSQDHHHKHGHKHNHKHKEDHHNKHGHKHENQHENDHKHTHEYKHDHKQDEKHKNDEEHKHKHSHKAGHKHGHHHGHKHGHAHHHHGHGYGSHGHLRVSGPKFKKLQSLKNQVEVVSDPIEVSPRKRLNYKDYSHWTTIGKSQGYKIMEHDPFDTTTKLFKNLLSTTPSPKNLAEAEDDLDSLNTKDQNYEEPEYENNDSSDYNSENSHPDHIQEYIDNSKGDLENYADYDYTEPKIQYAEKVELPNGKYEWNTNELNKYLEQTYGTKHKEGKYDDYLNEASSKVEHQVTPSPGFKMELI